MDIANSARQSVAIPTRTKRRAMDWSLVLASQDIPTTIAFTEEHRWALMVEAQDYERAVEAIRQYRVENRHWGWRRQLPWSQVTYHAGAVPACLVLVLIYQISVEFPHLHNSWILDTNAVHAGQWWRLCTAVLLHADLAHLAANATTGVLLFGLAMARFGAGCALLAAYLAGALGNVAGVLLQTRPYTGLGASGMIMGALGLLSFHSASLWRTNPATARDLLRGMLGGVFLFLIFGGIPRGPSIDVVAHVDVIAHLGGFLAGAIFGTLLSFVPVQVLERTLFKTASWILLSALLIVTGWLGLKH